VLAADLAETSWAGKRRWLKTSAKRFSVWMQRRAPVHHGMRAALRLSQIAAHDDDGFHLTPDRAGSLLAVGKQATRPPG
jgi:hypothetical protein